MADVSVSLGCTINTGNFENIRVEYSMVDKIRNYEDEAQAFDRVEKIVEARLQQRIKDERES